MAVMNIAILAGKITYEEIWKDDPEAFLPSGDREITFVENKGDTECSHSFVQESGDVEDITEDNWFGTFVRYETCTNCNRRTVRKTRSLI